MPSSDTYTLSLHDALPICLRIGTDEHGRASLAHLATALRRVRDPGRGIVLDRNRAAALGDDIGSVASDLVHDGAGRHPAAYAEDRKSTRLNSSHVEISYAVLRHLHSFPTRRSSDLSPDRHR